MTAFVLKDTNSGEYLKKTDAWGHTLTADINQARVYVTAKDARRTATNRPRYAEDPVPQLVPVAVRISEVDINS
jgi:hypothetical protein